MENPLELTGKILGTCRLDRIIGRGGSSVVYLAQQSRPKRPVAVKILLPDQPPGSELHQQFLRRFEHEADIIARLEHKHIIQIFEYNEQFGYAFLVMPYISGGNLLKVLKLQGRLSLEQAVGYLTQAADALDYAHAHGVVHRDLKPGNFLLRPKGELLLSDFGIAHIMQYTDSGPDLTSPSLLLGTPEYMAPEMARGEVIDHYADIYELGIVLYQLLSGDLPFKGEAPYMILLKHLEERVPLLHTVYADIPAPVDEVIQRATAKRREDRYSSAGQMAQALQSVLRAPQQQVPGRTYEASTELSSPASQTSSVIERTESPEEQKNGNTPEGDLNVALKERLVQTNIEDMPFSKSEAAVGSLSQPENSSNLSKSFTQEEDKIDELIERIDIAIHALSDTPSEIDLLRFSDYADALADFIKSEKTQKPLTIAIDAAWGMGKTTLMRMIKSRLENDANTEKLMTSPFKRGGIQKNTPTQSTFPIVWFNAWQYDKEDSLWAALVLEILEQVRKHYTLKKKVDFWWNLTQRRLGKRNQLLLVIFRVLPFFIGLLILSAILFAIAWFWNGGTSIATFKTIILSISGTLGIFALVYASVKDLYIRIIKPNDRKILQLYQNLAQYVHEPNYKDRIGFLAQFKEDFSAIVETATSGGKWPLIIFIDDLDRCAPPKPVEIIEAINLLLDAQYCVFVMGMDVGTVAGSIQAKYKDLLSYLEAAGAPGELTLGQRFLEKIIQITFHLPRADTIVVQSFIDIILSGVEQNRADPPLRGQILEVAQLIEAEQRGGKQLDTAAEIVQQARSDISDSILVKAKEEIRAKSFDDSQVVQKAIRQVAPYLELNPRKIKRFINMFRLQALIANRRGLLDTGVIKLDVLARWIVISTRWPTMVDALLNEEDFVNRLKSAYRFLQIVKNERMRELESDAINERLRLLEGYQGQLDTYKTDPHIKLLMDADDLMTLLEDLTDADIKKLPDYLHLTQMTYQNI